MKIKQFEIVIRVAGNGVNNLYGLKVGQFKIF